MAFSAPTQSVTGGAGLSSTVSLSGSQAAGDFLVAKVHLNVSATLPAISAPSGFARVADYQDTYVTHAVYVKESDGTETSLTWTNDDADRDIQAAVTVYPSAGGGALVGSPVKTAGTTGVDSITLGPATAQSGDLVVGTHKQRDDETTSSWSDGFVEAEVSNNAGSTFAESYKISAGASESTTRTLAATTRNHAGMLLIFREAASAPTITNINTTNEVTPGEAGTLTGTNLTNATGLNIGSQAQADFTVVSDTEVTFTGTRGGNPYNQDLTATLLSPDGNATITVQQVPATGFAVTAASPNTTDDASLWTGLIDIATSNPITIVDGDQALVTDPNNLGNLTVTPAGEITSDTEGNFTVQIWLTSEGVWGSDQTVTFEEPSSPPAPGNSGIRFVLKGSTKSNLKQTMKVQ